MPPCEFVRVDLCSAKVLASLRLSSNQMTVGLFDLLVRATRFWTTLLL